jgi:hypothetical protein
MENGLRSDVGARHPKLLDAFAAKIAAWEKNHPKAMPVLRHSLSELEEQQLRSLGYLE